MKVLKAFVIGIALFVGIGLNAQDIHFSQFYMSPLNLNPALTGVMNCNTRFVGNYRNQWASVLKSNAYNTYSQFTSHTSSDFSLIVINGFQGPTVQHMISSECR